MSLLNVDKVDPSTGTALELGTSGDTITVPTGAGLTVVDEVKTNKISPATGTAFTLGDSGDTFTVPSGATIANSGTATGFGDATNFRPNVDPLIINGDMELSQRGASFASNGYTLDRWIMDENSDGAVTVTQDTDVPSGYGFAKSLKVDVTTADASIAANQSCGFTQFFEGQNLQLLKYGTSNAENLTLSFWVKSVKTGTYCIRFVKEAGGLTRYETPIEYTISSASTWEKKVINLSPTAGSTSLITGAAGVIVNSNASGFRIMFTLAAGTDYHSTNNTWVAGSNKFATSNQVNFLDSTSNNFWLTGVQLEVGEYTSATLPPFQHESYGDNLARCQRYYQLVQNWSGGVVNASTAYVNAQFWCTMRTTPSVTTTGALNGNDITDNRNQSSGQVTLHGANENGFWGGVGNWSSLTTNNPFNSRFQNTNKLAFSSEL